MKANSFKIIGVLLMLLVTVTICIGSAAAATPIYDGSVTVVDGSFAQTAPPVNYMSPGQYVYADTDAGILNAAYDAGSFTYNLTRQGTTDVWNIADINGISTVGTKKWYIYINNARAETLTLRDVANGKTVAFIHTDNPKRTITQSINDAGCDLYIKAAVTVLSAPENLASARTVTITPGTFNISYPDWDNTMISFTNVPSNSGLGVLIAGAAQTPTYTPDIGASSYAGSSYTWLKDINDYSADWSATGYGYAIFKMATDGETLTSTDSLEKFTLNSGESLYICSTASSTGGVKPTGYTGQEVLGTDNYTVYYPDAATKVLKVTVA